jgi:hypothetical protein
MTIEPGAKRMAKGKLNMLGEYNHMSAHLNSSPRCTLQKASPGAAVSWHHAEH